MKYLLMIYSNPANWGHPTFQRAAEALVMSAGERDELQQQFVDLLREISASGELVGSDALADPEITRTVRVRNGVTTVTDGPFGEAKEQFAGYFIVDCDSCERAEQIAARFPDALFGAVVVRPIVQLSGQEM
jgi:hypothetical protein